MSLASRILENHKNLVRDKSRYFLLWYSDCPKYMRIIGNRDYFRKRGVESKLVFMPPEEYLQKCAEGFGCTLEQSNQMIKPENVEKYKTMMRSGHRFPCPILSYNKIRHTFLQEGRHRAKACLDMNIPEIPVWIITSYTDANNDLEKLPLIDNNIQLLSKIQNVWKPANDDPTGFIRNWNFVDKTHAQDLIDKVSNLQLAHSCN